MLPDRAIDPEAMEWVGVENHAVCVSRCRALAVPSPFDRERPPMKRCDWCGAGPGEACQVVGSRGRRHRAPLRTFGRSHPSRLEEAA